MSEALLSVENLSIGFQTETDFVRVVESVTFNVAHGQTVGLVGESGCGKSVTAQTIMRLLPSPPSRIESGRIGFDGLDLASLPERQMQKVRGDRIGMIFQEPMTSLNPTMTVGDQIAEVLSLHRALDSRAARPKVIDILQKVGIGSPERRLDQYPHQLSGGLRQRVMIAMALVCRPKLLIADEPTTALDVTIQAQIIALLRSLQEEMGLAILLITHDLGVVAETCSAIVVMYAGRIVERGPAARVLKRPRHPYTAGLLAASPANVRKGQRLQTIAGTVPPPGRRGTGCAFADRCPRRIARCTAEMPLLELLEPEHWASCFNPVLQP